MPELPEKDIRVIITDPNGTELLVRHARDIGQFLTRKDTNLSTSQIRSLFGEVRQIQAQWTMEEKQQELARRRMILLKPKMAYRARKETGSAVKELVKVLDPAIDKVIELKDLQVQREAFQRFVDFFEAILAYHKAFGGK